MPRTESMKLVENPKDFDELAECMAKAMNWIGHSMVDHGMEHDDAAHILEQLANLNKWFACNYADMLGRGDIPVRNIYALHPSHKANK